LLFTQLFRKHFIPVVTYPGHTETGKEVLQKKIKKHWKKFLLAYGLLALMVFALIILVYHRYTTPDPAKVMVTLMDTTAKKGYSNKSFSVNPNQVLQLKTVCTYKGRSGRFTFGSKTKFNWGDGAAVDDKNFHRYAVQGRYDLVAYVEVLYDYKIIRKDTLHWAVFVCAETNSLKVNYGSTSRIAINTPTPLTAVINPANPPNYVKWVSDGADLFYGNVYYVSFPVAGNYVVGCMAVYDSINSPCTIRQDIFFTAYDPGLVTRADTAKTRNAEAGPQPEDEAPKKTAAPFLFTLYIWLAIIFGALAVLFAILYEKERIDSGKLKKTVSEKYSRLTGSFKGKKKPGVVPFRNKNYLPLHQTEINNAARLMRKRVSDNSRFLHIGKTIARSIRNNGLLQPVTVPRTRQTEYLVLIDETYSNGQLVKLFEYLLLECKKQNILYEKYYYSNDIKKLHSAAEQKGISLEKLFSKHEQHILLIFGDAQQLIDKDGAGFNNDELALLNRWQYKAILTPLSYADWTTDEKNILLPNIPLFPLDVEGLLLMAEQLADTENSKDIISRLNQHRSLFYKTAGINFESITQLERYCSQAKWANNKDAGINILFQWIAALAVYPRISWEITISIGKAILDRYDSSQELNFSNLLRIARISWMQRGIFPDGIRLELLQKLSIGNEQLARETILMLLEEIPASEIEDNSLAQEEKEIQQIINEFSLYAHDPVFYSSYKQSAYIYEQLIKEDKLKDGTTELYFKNPDNNWSTLINQPSADDNHNTHVGTTDYFSSLEKEDTLLGRFYLWLCIISLFVFVTSLFALRILYQWKTATDL